MTESFAVTKMQRLIYNIFYKHILNRPKLRLFLTSLLVPNENVTIDLFGAPLYINTRDEIGCKRAYDFTQMCALLRDETGPIINLSMILRSGDAFIDVGSNVGLFTSVLSRAQNICKGVKFYAFEPNPDTFVRLSKSVAGQDVQLFQVGLSDTDGELTFCEGVTSGAFAPLMHSGRKQILDRQHTIACRRLDSFTFDSNSLVIKLDAEGHELKILAGAKQLLEQKRVKAVLIDGCSSEAKDFLAQANFALFHGHTLKPVADSLPRCILAIRKECLPLM